MFAMDSNVPEELFIIPASALALLLVFGLRKLVAVLLPGSSLTKEYYEKNFSDVLGLTGGKACVPPARCSRISSTRKRMASLDLEFTVKNPRGAWLRIHKKGFFNRPVAKLPPAAETPPLLDARGFLLRLAPEDALTPEAAAALDRGLEPLCRAGLYDVILEGDKFVTQAARNFDYPVAEARELLASAAEAARQFDQALR